MPQLRLYLFGSPRLERDGVPVEVDTRKAIALMAYLAVTGQSHSRDSLAALLWPDYDQSHARAALRRTLSALNKAITTPPEGKTASTKGAGGEWLEIDRETIGLNRGTADLWVDVEEFERRLSACRTHGHPVNETCPACLAPLAEAAALYRADFLAGFNLRDSSDFDEWQFFQTENLRRELATVLEGLVRGATAEGDFERAISYGRRWLSFDPLHEPVHRQLMQLYVWAGQRTAALRQYRECVRVLDQELGVPPLEETTRLYEAIQENQLPPPPRRVTLVAETTLVSAAPAPASTPPAILKGATATPAGAPLVGRESEWAAMLTAYQAVSLNGHVVSLEGEAGIGKTRLAEEFLQVVRAGGAVTITGRCYEGEAGLAYGVFVEGLRAALTMPETSAASPDNKRLAGVPAPWLSEAARLLPELAAWRPGLPPAPPLDGPGAQSRFFEGINQLLLAICRGPRPGVIFLDDLHWADAASLELLTYLVRRLRGRPLFLLLAWRNEGVPAGHPLRYLLGEARRLSGATFLNLTRLSRAAVVALVSSAAQAGLLTTARAAGPAGPDDLGERLYQETEGLPFFLVEYLAKLAQAGPENDDWSMPGGVRELLRARLAGVSETAWQLLTTGAVIGRSFDFETLRMASGRSDEETITALEESIGQGLVTEMTGGGERGPSYDFSHEKLRTLVYEETSLARRRLLHRRVAEALLARARGRYDIGPLAGQVAQHYRLAGQENEAAEYFRLAGEHARTLYANTAALDAFRSALALGHPNSLSLHESIGDLLTLRGEYNAALTSYETAAALTSGPALAHLEHKLGTVHHRRGDWDLAESHFQAAEAALHEAGLLAEDARLYADWSLTAHRSNQVLKALDMAQRSRKLAEAAGDTRALARVHNILGILARSQDNPALACQHLEQSLAMAEASGEPGLRIAALNNLALAYRSGGDTGRAIQLTETALALCATQGDRHLEAALHNNLADLFHEAGQGGAAMNHLKQAVTLFAEIGSEAGTPQPEIWKLVEW